MPSYKLSYDKDIADQLRNRFTSEVAALQNEGFSPFSLHQEVIYPFSLLIFFPIYLAMLMGHEIMRIESPLRITSFHLMYASQARATYAYIYGLGCKFYTNFTDGTWLVTNTHQKTKNKAVIILESDPDLSLPHQVWKRHQEKVHELEASGKHLNPRLSFDTWANLEQQFDQGSLGSIMSIGLIWLVLVAWALYGLISSLLRTVGAGSS